MYRGWQWWVVNGRLSLQFSRDAITMATAATETVINDGEWHTAEVEVHHNTTAFLLVDSNERVNASSAMSLALFAPSPDNLFIGGLPSHLPTTGRYVRNNTANYCEWTLNNNMNTVSRNIWRYFKK